MPAWLGVLLAIGAGLVAFAQFRGFDVMDGALYFTLYQDPVDNPDTHTRFHLLARPLWLLCQQDIVAFRFATLLGFALVAWLFSRVLRRELLPSFARWVIVVPILVATFAGLSWVPLALTYNSLAALFTLLALSVLLTNAGSRSAQSGWRRSSFAWTSMAVLSVGLFLVKPPSALAVAAAAAFLASANPRFSSGTRKVILGCGLACALVVSAAVLIIPRLSGYDPKRLHYVAGLAISPAWMAANLARYWTEIGAMLPALWVDIFWPIGPVALALIALSLGAKNPSALKGRLVSFSLALILMSILGATGFRGLWDSSFSSVVAGNAARFYLLAWSSLLPIWLVSIWTCAGAARPTLLRLAWVAVLFLLPLISSLGSTNAMYVSALHETVLWVAGLLIVADNIGELLSVRWFRTAVACLLALGAAGHLFSGLVLRPYMYQPSLWKQTDAVDIGYPATRLKVDPALADFIRYVRSTLERDGFKPGDDVFGFFNLPGIIFAIGAKEPGAPWYFGTWYSHDDTDGGKLRRVPLERRRRAWILTQADVTGFRKQFLESGIDFPDGYRKIGSTRNPTTGLEIGIWKPIDRH